MRPQAQHHLRKLLLQASPLVGCACKGGSQRGSQLASVERAKVLLLSLLLLLLLRWARRELGWVRQGCVRQRPRFGRHGMGSVEGPGAC